MSVSIKTCNQVLDGKDIMIYSLTNENGLKVEICNLGASVLSLITPDRDGKYHDVVLGFEKIESYFENKPFFGATIGRHANRIEDASFEVKGVQYRLAQNDGNNHLHGGNRGFDKVVWEGAILNKEEACVAFHYTSEDMEENYPGRLETRVTYTLSSDNALRIDYFAVSDKDTVVNLTNHSYFNLSGHDSGDIGNHELMINGDCFTIIDDHCIPTGEIISVEGTALDFRTFKTIAKDLNSCEQQIMNGKGYDHNYVLRSRGDLQEKAAEVFDPASGRRLEVYTTKPGIQFYSGNHLEGLDTGKNGAVYKKWSGFCLETQYFPNAMKHKSFPSPILKKEQEYKHTTVYKFL
ncbi:MAG: Aldose 1-epimerase [Clostridia bacterium]|jgi:aldose 1-epimerase|nr:Aldose 1-epimerase [Clostridia bacterium]